MMDGEIGAGSWIDAELSGSRFRDARLATRLRTLARRRWPVPAAHGVRPVDAQQPDRHARRTAVGLGGLPISKSVQT